MPNTWELHLERWTAAGVVDTSVRDRILTWERENTEPQGLRWPVWIALAFGAILLGAGILLFVSAHWDQMSPAWRMTLLVAMIALLHAGGAVASSRLQGLSITLHTLGTISLGAAIALAGQIFNLSEHWPSAVLLWALGAAAAWALLGHWTQATLTAILLPYWLVGEWWTLADAHSRSFYPISVGVCALSFAYLSARRGPDDSSFRKALGWLGGIALVPAVFAIGVEGPLASTAWSSDGTLAWAIAILIPLAVAVVLRGREALWAGVGIGWAVLMAAINAAGGGHLAIYFWSAIGATGLALWGTDDSRPERINLGVIGFALTVLFFYFSDVMDKFDRATGLIAGGLLFLAGGWLLERTRRGLMTHIRQEAI
ncbi:MAG TPA: DUF2157 domain-containing protein [Bryobacteraceae bacterium]|nr:DUF2157 domain-containing protein [Bryobacteraceae bacterium]